MPTTHSSKADFNGDGRADLLLANNDGSYFIWNLGGDGRALIGGGYIPNPNSFLDTTNPPGGPTWRLTTVGDFNGDGTADLAWQNASNIKAITYVGANRIVSSELLSTYGIGNPLRATADVNGDARDDVVWFIPPAPIAGGADGLWVTGDAGNRPIPNFGLGPMEAIPVDFRFEGVGDFNGDGKDDFLFRGQGNATVGTFLIENLNTQPWQPGATGLNSSRAFFRDPGSEWEVVKVADFNADGRSDLLWHSREGLNAVWLMDNATMAAGAFLPYSGDYWRPVDAQDTTGDGKADILWLGQGGEIAQWTMDGLQLVSGGIIATVQPGAWSLAVL